MIRFLAKKRRWIIKEKRPAVVIVRGSHHKTIIYGVLSLDGK
ncbi:MAG TPA: hypothetical protein VIY08_07745 [Candidatus Nitrosocosmicus sp.]